MGSLCQACGDRRQTSFSFQPSSKSILTSSPSSSERTISFLIYSMTSPSEKADWEKISTMVPRDHPVGNYSGTKLYPIIFAVWPQDSPLGKSGTRRWSLTSMSLRRFFSLNLSSLAAEPTTATDPRYGERLSCSSISSFLSARLLGVYYRVFFQDGAIPTLHPASSDDPFLGRVLATSTVASKSIAQVCISTTTWLIYKV